MRIHIIEKIIFIFMGLIALALFYMQIIHGDHYHEQSVNNRIRLIPYDAPRGRIFDRNGLILADSRTIYNAVVIPQDVEDASALFKYLGHVVHKDALVLERLYKHRKISPFDPVVLVEDVDRDTLIKLEENKFQFPGLDLIQSFKRFYPFHEAAAHVVGNLGRIDPTALDVMREYGYTPASFVGKTGVEQFYESYLDGEAGGKQIEVNSRGQQVRLLGTKEPQNGKDIVLTIDARIQNAVSQMLGQRPGAVLVMDMANGEILSLVSSPSFDPDAFTDRLQRYRVPGYAKDPFHPLLNRAIAGQFPPGSVFKIPVALAAIERGKVQDDTTFDCPGFYMLGKARFGCAHAHGKENILQAIAHSCNVYFFHVGQLVTAPLIGAYAKAFGLTHPTGIDLPYESSGKMILPGQKKGGWFTGNTLNLSIGQGDTMVTPIQLLVMMAAVANDGLMLRPRVVKSIAGHDVPLLDLLKCPVVRLKSATWQIIQQGLRDVVTDKDGTAHMLNDLVGVKVSGKTGTAQAGRQGDHSWFVGYLNSPKANLAFCVFLEHGGSSSNAVAITHDLLKQLQDFGVI